MHFNSKAGPFILACLLLPNGALGQRPGQDPIGTDPNDGLESVTPPGADEEVREVLPVLRGAVLTAISGVREEQHEVEVTLGHGFALVDVRMRFVSSARHLAELRYRLAVPQGASLAELEVSNAQGSRSGLVDASAGNLGPYDDAVRSRGANLPVAHAALVRDGNGDAIFLRAAPVAREGRVRSDGTRTPPGAGPLNVRVRYVVATPLRGGRARLMLPARGADNRVVPAHIRVRSDELSGAAVDGIDALERAVERAAWQPAEITARLAAGPSIALEAFQVRCGTESCTRLRAVALPSARRPRDVIVLLDASPSTNGPARGRIGPSLAALLSSLPRQSRVSIAVFASRAEAVIEEPTDSTNVSLVEIARALERPLGSATRFEAAWTLVGPWVQRARDPLIVLIGDGGLTSGADTQRAFAELRASGATFASVNVSDRPSTDALRNSVGGAGGLVLEVGAEADRAARAHGMDALDERLSPLFAPVLGRVRARIGNRTIEIGSLRAGEELVWEGRAARASIVSSRTLRASAAPAELSLVLRDRVERASGQRPLRLAAVAAESIDRVTACNERASSASAPVGNGERLTLADPRRCDRPAVPETASTPQTLRTPQSGRLARREGVSHLPPGSLLEMLRQRIVPIARGCFRSDRAGRASYQTRAIFEFSLADREIASANVSGRITQELRSCLLAAVDTLEIPRFDGTVHVRYPIYTAPELAPPTLTLDADIADAVDAIGAGAQSSGTSP